MQLRKTRAEQVEVNAARLLAAALKVFTREGFHGASLEKVASAAGLTKGAVYARFETKADLMLALLAVRVDERLAQIEAMMEAAELQSSLARASARFDTTDAITALTRQWAVAVEGDLAWWLLVLEFRCHAARSRTLNAKYARTHARLREGVAALFAQRLALEPQVADELARISLASSNGYVLERAVDGDGFPSTLFQRAAKAMVTGMTTPTTGRGKR